jgi:hypothetical protein
MFVNYLRLIWMFIRFLFSVIHFPCFGDEYDGCPVSKRRMASAWQRHESLSSIPWRSVGSHHKDSTVAWDLKYLQCLALTRGLCELPFLGLQYFFLLFHLLCFSPQPSTITFPVILSSILFYLLYIYLYVILIPFDFILLSFCFHSPVSNLFLSFFILLVLIFIMYMPLHFRHL